MQRAAEIGYDINRGTNGIALPTTNAESLNTGLPLHRGKHIPAYFNHANNKLQRLQRAYNTGSLNDDALLRSLGRIETQIRNDLIQDRIRLQHVDPRP